MLCTPKTALATLKNVLLHEYKNAPNLGQLKGIGGNRWAIFRVQAFSTDVSVQICIINSLVKKLKVFYCITDIGLRRMI